MSKKHKPRFDRFCYDCGRRAVYAINAIDLICHRAAKRRRVPHFQFRGRPLLCANCVLGRHAKHTHYYEVRLFQSFIKIEKYVAAACRRAIDVGYTKQPVLMLQSAAATLKQQHELDAIQSYSLLVDGLDRAARCVGRAVDRSLCLDVTPLENDLWKLWVDRDRKTQLEEVIYEAENTIK